MPSISLATVYKNIDTFVDHRMMKDISPNYGSRRIESASAPHDHFVCRVCRRVFDLKEHTELAPPRRSDLPEGASFEYHVGTRWLVPELRSPRIKREHFTIVSSHPKNH
jgi:Fur family peroxide stress response transcriptional regulator